MKRMPADVSEALKRPRVRDVLQRAAFFITAYEVTKTYVVTAVESFFRLGDKLGPRYQTDVLARHRSVYRSSLLWIADMGGLTAAQVERMEAVREHRNVCAHNLARVIVGEIADVDATLLDDLRSVFRSIELFFNQIEIDTNPGFEGAAAEDVYSGVGLLLTFLHDVVTNPASAE